MYKFYLLLFSLAIPLFSNAQQGKLISTTEELDSVAQLIQETYEVPGLAIGIIKDNEIFYTKGLGVQGLNSEDPLTASSLFHMASVSKPFVATAVMQLVEAGRMNLDDKLVDYLPYFKMKDKRYQKITIKKLKEME